MTAYCQEHKAHEQHFDTLENRVDKIESIQLDLVKLNERVQTTIENQQKTLDTSSNKSWGLYQIAMTAMIAWIPWVVTYAFPAIAH